MSEPNIRKLPPEAEELLNDPQLADLKYRGENLPNEGKVLQPSRPAAVGESRFLIFHMDFEYAQPGNAVWHNMPSPRGSLGYGNGFPTLKNEQPRFTVDQPKPPVVPAIWKYVGWLVASPEVAATIKAFDADAIETVPLDWTYADGHKLDGYVFLDVRRMQHAYDYRRSAVVVEMRQSGKFVSNVIAPRALKQNLPTDLHVFREAYLRRQIFFSRELAKALLPHGKGFYFEDPAASGAVKF